jgi:hypothetical protein
MFVTVDNFNKLPYQIPNLLENDDTTFNQYIQDVEDRDLPESIGGYFYDKLVEALLALPPLYVVGEDTAINDQYVYGNDIWKALAVVQTAPVAGSDWELIEANNRWLLIKNGASYKYNKRKCRWLGMEQMVTPLVFASHLRDNAQTVTGTGVVELKSENSKSEDPGQLIFKAMGDYATKLGSVCNQINSLYGYLVSVAVDFDDLFTEDDYGTMLEYLDQEFCASDSENEFDL